MNNTETFNNAEESFWFSGWKTKYNDLSQLAQNGYVELWVKASVAVEFEVRLPSDRERYYTKSVEISSHQMAGRGFSKTEALVIIHVRLFFCLLPERKQTNEMD